LIVTQAQQEPIVVSGMTGADGWFRALLPPGDYSVLALVADARWLRTPVKVVADGTTTLAGVLAGVREVTTIREPVPRKEPVPARAIRETVKRVLLYTDEAIDGDYWSTCWLLLDVDERGVVTAFRFLHRPGHGLDAIAENEVFSLRFDPARDATGRPV